MLCLTVCDCNNVDDDATMKQRGTGQFSRTVASGHIIPSVGFGSEKCVGSWGHCISESRETVRW